MNTIEDVSPSQYRALAEFRYHIRKFMHFSERGARAAGLEPQQHQLLLTIKGFAGEGDGPTIGYVAERLKLRHHSTVELIDRMEERQMVYRRAGEDDRRHVIVGLTAGAEAILTNLSSQHITEIRQMGPDLVAALQAVLTCRTSN
jgi:DNA-binding MarR family transcriptional regulator